MFSESAFEGVGMGPLWWQNEYAAGGRMMNRAPGCLRLMGRSCSEPSPPAPLTSRLIKVTIQLLTNSQFVVAHICSLVRNTDSLMQNTFRSYPETCLSVK